MVPVLRVVGGVVAAIGGLAIVLLGILTGMRGWANAQIEGMWATVLVGSIVVSGASLALLVSGLVLLQIFRQAVRALGVPSPTGYESFLAAVSSIFSGLVAQVLEKSPIVAIAVGLGSGFVILVIAQMVSRYRVLRGISLTILPVVVLIVVLAWTTDAAAKIKWVKGLATRDWLLILFVVALLGGVIVAVAWSERRQRSARGTESNLSSKIRGGKMSVTETVRNAIEGAAGESTEVKAAVGAAAAKAAIPPPEGAGVGTLWTILVAGLVFGLVIALGGLIYTIADGNPDTSPDLLVTAFTAILTGLIGLFVKSPT
ncbi:hypothetical protein ACFWUU_05365 [Kribbella sp. NPDC058693]|uniref:hypothetical protein n=1 Tax=Kribbella sp. NPDC058693 TaxID=3346602 RepID=UPI00365B899E